ncbi:kinase-like domain-containing protein [Xylariomycetidae sp. FL0641]|nr:kinase-like domain-containing protein [Xylariomycetidae sp. FL0641]
MEFAPTSDQMPRVMRSPATPHPGNFESFLHIRAKVIRSLLLQSRSDVYDSRNRFTPSGTLTKTIDRELVRQALSSLSIPQDEDLDGTGDVSCKLNLIVPCPEPGCHCRNERCTGCRIIFTAALVTLEPDVLFKLLQTLCTEFCDSDLPFRPGAAQGKIIEIVRLLGASADLFFHWRCRLQAPYIEFRTINSRDQSPTVIEDGLTLPWVTRQAAVLPVNESTPYDGQSSSVYEISIHQGYCSPAVEGTNFALKEFHEDQLPLRLRGAIDPFLDEFRINLAIPRNDHIVPLLAAFKHRDKSYLLFPWAQEGNLRDLWAKYSPPGVEEEKGQQQARWYSTDWLLNQAWGLADALAVTHGRLGTYTLPSHEANPPQSYSDTRRQFVLHADIKPDNILCFHEDEPPSVHPVLKLADFGLALKSESDSNFSREMLVPVRSYRAPEFDVHDTDQPLDLKSDVWSLGCVFSELVTWSLSGVIGLNKHIDDRATPLKTSPAQVTEDTFFEINKTRYPQRPWSMFIPKFESSMSSFGLLSETKHSLEWRSSRLLAYCQLKKAVTDHFDILRRSCLSDDRVRHFLDLIQREMLEVDPRRRASSERVCDVLRDLRNSD